MLFQTLSQCYVIKVVIGINGSSQTLFEREMLHMLPDGSRARNTVEKLLSMVHKCLCSASWILVLWLQLTLLIFMHLSKR